MKYLISSILFSCLMQPIFCQSEFLITKDWPVGTSKIISASTVTRLEGSNRLKDITNIGYESPAILKIQLEKDAEEELWTEDEKRSKLYMWEKAQQGGRITLYITRSTIDAANTKFFTIIIQDVDGNELFRQELDDRLANVPGGDGAWWNANFITIKEELPKQFTVYVIDRLGIDTKRFKFEVSSL